MDKTKSIKKIGYGTGSLGYSAVSQTISTLIMFFGTSVAGISGTLVGLCISIGTVWDAVTDPIVGYISDKSSQTGVFVRQKYILISSVFMALCNMLIWSIPLNLTSGQKFLWLLITLLAYETADTFYATPYSALGYEMSNGNNDATSIQAIKSVFNLIGMIFPSILMFVFMDNPTERLPYIKIGLCTSCVVLFCAITCVLSLKTRRKNNIIVNLPIFKKNFSISQAFLTFFDFFKAKKNRLMIFGYSISMLATSLLTSLGMHVFTYTFHFNSAQISILLLSLLVGAMISQFFITKISNKNGKIRTLIFFITLTILCIGLISVIFVLRKLFNTSINFIFCAFLILFCGFGSGALYSLPFSIFADIIETENKNNRENKTATLSGIMTFVFKITNAISLFLIGIILDVIKFDSSQPVQALKVQNSLGAIMLLGVALSLSISIMFFSQYEKYQ